VFLMGPAAWSQPQVTAGAILEGNGLDRQRPLAHRSAPVTHSFARRGTRDPARFIIDHFPLHLPTLMEPSRAAPSTATRPHLDPARAPSTILIAR
jgi:hypothetical protein